ncbi:phosphotransferase [Shewanella olleyana]|uniref:phosphotransferase n=1 Tax=Shewanella olleyana TaxID=135626 RepID=UPI00200C413F|nr:phosphotransferase [Shewanella olleyana]MCL1068186.1 phosphotransferase [Shewanella olleyana]
MNHLNPWSLLPSQLKSQLPAKLVMVIGEECLGIEKLSAGLSNTNYHLKMANQDWVLRDNKDIQQWCDRDNEVTCWQRAESIGLAPKLIWQSDNQQFYLSKFIIQQQFDWASTYGEFGFNTPRRPSENKYQQNNSDNKNIEPVGLLLNMLNQLATLPLPPKKISVTAQWQVYLESLAELSSVQKNYQPENKHSQSQQWHACFNQLNKLQSSMTLWLADLESCLIKPQFCHRDLSPFNLLLHEDKLHCIDFEYCATSHPMFDLASVLATHQLTDEQANDLSEQYLFKHPNLKPDSIQYLPQIYNCFWAFGAAWALMMAAGTEAADKALGSDTDTADVTNSYFILFNKYLSLIS